MRTPRVAALFAAEIAIRIQFLAIRENYQGTRLPLSLAKSLLGSANRFRDVCSALRDDRRVEFVKRGQHRVIVERQRSLQKSRAGKGHQTDSIAAHQAKQILRDELGSRQAGSGRHP